VRGSCWCVCGSCRCSSGKPVLPTLLLLVAARADYIVRLMQRYLNEWKGMRMLLNTTRTSGMLRTKSPCLRRRSVSCRRRCVHSNSALVPLFGCHSQKEVGLFFSPTFCDCARARLSVFVSLATFLTFAAPLRAHSTLGCGICRSRTCRSTKRTRKPRFKRCGQTHRKCRSSNSRSKRRWPRSCPRTRWEYVCAHTGAFACSSVAQDTCCSCDTRNVYTILCPRPVAPL